MFLCFIKFKLKFDDYKNCHEANQLEKGINHLEKNLIKILIKFENHRQLILNNRLILRSYHRYRDKNIMYEEVNKIALSIRDDKIIQSIDSIRTYAYRTNKIIMQKK